MFKQIRARFRKPVVEPEWSPICVGEFTFWVLNREHLRITYMKGTPEAIELLKQCSFRIANGTLFISHLEVNSNHRRVGWGTEAVKELNRRFPKLKIEPDAVLTDPNSIAFWKNLERQQMIEPDALQDAEANLKRHQDAPFSLLRQQWSPESVPTSEGKKLMERYHAALKTMKQADT